MCYSESDLSIHLIYTNTIHHCSVLIDGFTRNNILALSGTRLSPVLRSQNGQIGIFFFFLKHHSHSTGFLSYTLKKFRSMKELFGCSSGESLKRFCVKPDNRVASYWSQRTFNLLKNPVSMWMEELGWEKNLFLTCSGDNYRFFTSEKAWSSFN